jgi:hypothetical protein
MAVRSGSGSIEREGSLAHAPTRTVKPRIAGPVLLSIRSDRPEPVGKVPVLLARRRLPGSYDADENPLAFCSSVAEGQQLIRAAQFKGSADPPLRPQQAEDVAVVLRSFVGSQDHGEPRRIDELQLA